MVPIPVRVEDGYTTRMCCFTVPDETVFLYSARPKSQRKVDVGLSGKGISNSHGARPVYLIITGPRSLTRDTRQVALVPIPVRVEDGYTTHPGDSSWPGGRGYD